MHSQPLLALWGLFLDWLVMCGSALLFHFIGYKATGISPLQLESRPRFYRSWVGSVVLWLSIFVAASVMVLGTECWLTAATGGPRPYILRPHLVATPIVFAVAATAAVIGVQWDARQARRQPFLNSWPARRSMNVSGATPR